MANNYALIEVHCEEPKFFICDCCDSDPITSRIYYRIAKPKTPFQIFRRYCEGCKDKMGTVIDWENEYENNYR